jgi:hypothetical protein
MTAFPALIRLMDQHGCPQVGYRLDSSSWKCGDGVAACRSLCSRIARPRKGLDRRAHGESWSGRSPIERVERERGQSAGRSLPCIRVVSRSATKRLTHSRGTMSKVSSRDNPSSEQKVRPSRLAVREVVKKIGVVARNSEGILNQSHRQYRDAVSVNARVFHGLKLQIVIFQFEIACEVEQLLRRRPTEFALKVALKDVIHKIFEYDRTLTGRHIKTIRDFGETTGTALVGQSIKDLQKYWKPKLKVLSSFVSLRNKATGHYDSDIEAQVRAIESICVEDALDVIFNFMAFNHAVTGIVRDIVRPKTTSHI